MGRSNRIAKSNRLFDPIDEVDGSTIAGSCQHFLEFFCSHLNIHANNICRYLSGRWKGGAAAVVIMDGFEKEKGLTLERVNNHWIRCYLVIDGRKEFIGAERPKYITGSWIIIPPNGRRIPVASLFFPKHIIAFMGKP